MALILAAVMAVSCLTTILLAASKPWTEIDLGSLSQYYETGTNADPGRISNVDGDSGGTSYGLYMFVEKTVGSFISWLQNPIIKFTKDSERRCTTHGATT